MRTLVRSTLVALAAALLLSAGAGAQSTATLTGRVTDDSGAVVEGVQIVVIDLNTDARTGSLTQADGRYAVAGLRSGSYRVRLSREAVRLDAMEVFATRAVERSTPVAFSDVNKVQIQNQLGSRDLPLVLNVAPGVYSTMQGGGSGDARINVRGFSQRNTAVMINGVPVNDVENGWVYWSNWDGLGDAATSVQLQRGMSAVNLATPSIGGTLNIITDPSTRPSGLSYKQEFGSGGFLKETVGFDTGERAGFALTGVFSRKTGDGLWGYAGDDRTGATDFGNATYTDSWSYYVAASYRLNDRNRFELYAVGAPQAHGQNLYKLNVATVDQDLARELGYSQAALDRFPEAGRFWSPNVAPVSRSYDGKQYASVGPETGEFERQGSGFLNERENYFHKPHVNLNYYSYLGDGLTWTTVGYYSGGSGGGSGTLGSLVWDYTYTQRFADWDATIARNRTSSSGSTGILRSSVNSQWTLGAISKLRKDFDAGVTAEVGVDWRTADIDHYRDVRDLLGGDYWLDDANEFTGPRQAGFGDRIDYDNSNTVDWFGGYGQIEKSGTDGSIYGMLGFSRNSYHFTDHFRKGPDGGKLTLESGATLGFQTKAGVSRNVTNEWSLFGNAGYVSKVPNFDGVINDVTGTLNPDPKNETFVSFEAGVNYLSRNRRTSMAVNLYHTTWKDQTQTLYVPNDDIQANVLGVDERHVGVEAEGAFQPSDLLRFDVAASLGNWKYLDDATGNAVSGDKQTSQEYAFFIKDLRSRTSPRPSSPTPSRSSRPGAPLPGSRAGPARTITRPSAHSAAPPRTGPSPGTYPGTPCSTCTPGTVSAT
jgi:hypothetical protein